MPQSIYQIVGGTKLSVKTIKVMWKIKIMVLSKSLESCVKVSCNNLGWKDVILTELNSIQNLQKLLILQGKKCCFVSS